MAEKTQQICGNCGNMTVLFCDNEFIDFYCTSCCASNLKVLLPKLETKIPCKSEKSHDIRIAKKDLLFCPICYTEFGHLKKEEKQVT